MIGTVETTTWTIIAREIDGVPQPTGQRTERRRASFAYRAEAEAWLREQQHHGFAGTVGMYATSYFGPTDSPSNCWEVSVTREVGS